MKFLRNYTPLYNKIKSYRPWMHYIDNTWLIITDKDAKQIYQSLNRHLYKDDKVLVTRMTDDYFGSLPKDAWTWIGKNRHLLYRSDLLY